MATICVNITSKGAIAPMMCNNHTNNNDIGGCPSMVDICDNITQSKGAALCCCNITNNNYTGGSPPLELLFVAILHDTRDAPLDAVILTQIPTQGADSP